MCRCTICGEKFGGIKVFDMHRIGKFPVVNATHPLPVGQAAKYRTCLSADGMRKKGLHQDKQGKWVQSFGHAKTLRLPASNRSIAA
jgi:hypothetical protein